jgi:hypothetical protein
VSRNRLEAAVEGWCSVEELTRWGFEHAQVVMANEAADSLAPPPLDTVPGVDGVIISTENALT